MTFSDILHALNLSLSLSMNIREKHFKIYKKNLEVLYKFNVSFFQRFSNFYWSIDSLPEWIPL